MVNRYRQLFRLYHPSNFKSQNSLIKEKYDDKQLRSILEVFWKNFESIAKK